MKKKVLVCLGLSSMLALSFFNVNAKNGVPFLKSKDKEEDKPLPLNVDNYDKYVNSLVATGSDIQDIPMNVPVYADGDEPGYCSFNSTSNPFGYSVRDIESVMITYGNSTYYSSNVYGSNYYIMLSDYYLSNKLYKNGFFIVRQLVSYGNNNISVGIQLTNLSQLDYFNFDSNLSSVLKSINTPININYNNLPSSQVYYVGADGKNHYTTGTWTNYSGYLKYSLNKSVSYPFGQGMTLDYVYPKLSQSFTQYYTDIGGSINYNEYSYTPLSIRPSPLNVSVQPVINDSSRIYVIDDMPEVVFADFRLVGGVKYITFLGTTDVRCKQNSVNDRLDSTIGEYDKIENDQVDNMVENLGKVDTSNPVLSNNGFVNSSKFLATQLTNIYNIEPFKMMSTYSLVIGLALIIVGIGVRKR